jgi:hypothetical protein
MDFMFFKEPFKMKVMQQKCKTQGNENYVPTEIKDNKLTLYYIKMQSSSMYYIMNVN